MSTPITLYIADDHPMIIDGIANMISRRPDIKVVGFASEVKKAMEAIRALLPDVVLLDLYFGDALGSEVIRKLREQGVVSKIIVYTVMPESGFALELLKLGAQGYLSKNSPIEEIVEAVRTVHKGKTYLSENFRIEYEAEQRKENASPFESLSRQEYTVMLLLIKGARVKDIQVELELSQPAVSTYTTRIFRKLGVKNLPELVRAAQLYGIQV